MIRMLTSTVSAVIMTTGVAAAEVPSDITATLKVTQWVADQIIANTDAAIERFKEKYPNVTIETQYVPIGSGAWGEYNNAFLNQVAAGDAPDIIAAAIEGFAEMASKEVLINLDDIAANDAAAQETMAGIDANLLNGMRTRGTGELNFFPTEWNNIVVFYNKDMFDAAGLDYPSADWTWEEFAETAKALTLTDGSGNITQYGYFVPGFNFGLQPWLFTNGASILDEEWKEPTIDTPQFREALQNLHDLIHLHKAAPAFEEGVGTEKFNAGQVAMFSAGHWPVPSIKQAGLENVGVQHMPQKTERSTVFGIGGLAITRASEHPELAWEFIREMTGDEYQAGLAEAGFAIPSARKYATTPEYVAWPDNSEIFYETAATAIAVPSPSNFSQVQEIFMRNLTTYLNGERDLDTTISNMDRELSRSMARAK